MIAAPRAGAPVAPHQVPVFDFLNRNSHDLSEKKIRVTHIDCMPLGTVDHVFPNELNRSRADPNPRHNLQLRVRKSLTIGDEGKESAAPEFLQIKKLPIPPPVATLGCSKILLMPSACQRRLTRQVCKAKPLRVGVYKSSAGESEPFAAMRQTFFHMTRGKRGSDFLNRVAERSSQRRESGMSASTNRVKPIRGASTKPCPKMAIVGKPVRVRLLRHLSHQRSLHQPLLW